MSNAGEPTIAPRGRLAAQLVALVAMLASVVGIGFAAARPVAAATTPVGDDAVVIAVIDTAITPYQYDYLASKMPQHRDTDPSNDVPVDQDPSTWLRGYAPTQVASFENIDITLPTRDTDTATALRTADAAKWSAVKPSTSAEVHLYHPVGTKILAAAQFGTTSIAGDTSEHGTGTSSVAAGAIHGSCPECLLVFLNGDSEQAINWAMRQPWIDVISNSYGPFDLGRRT